VDGNPVFVSGDKAQDGALSLQTTGNGDVAAHGAGPVNLDVIASLGDGKWTRFDLGGFRGAMGCNFWGLVTPGS
jgi:hypothetical protein